MNRHHHTVPRTRDPRSQLPAGLLALAITVLITAGCEREKPAPEVRRVPVKAAEVLVRDQTVYREYIGQTRGSTEVEIRARVEGILLEVHFSEGRFVQRGDLLYVIDPKPYEAALAQSQGELARAEAAWARARQDVARFTPLIERNAISRQQFDDAVATERAEAAVVQAAKAAVESAQLQLGYTRVTAPVDGLIGKSEVQVGNLVGRGQSTLLTSISTIDPIHARFSVSETEYLDWARSNPDPELAREQSRGKFELILADGSTFPHRGSVVFADRTVDPTTGTLLIEVAFPNPQKLLRPGLYAKVRFPKMVATNAVLVPQRAVQQLQTLFTVIVVNAEQKAEIRKVTPGDRVGSLWIINSGLKPGEIIVVEGMQKVQSGVLLNPTMTQIEEVPAATAGGREAEPQSGQ